MAPLDDRTPVSRPDYARSGLDWWPGEPAERIKFKIREAGTSDLVMLARLTHTKLPVMARWLTQHGYSVWVATRNQRNTIAVIVARHGPIETTVLRFYCSPGYPLEPILAKFTLLLSVEMPEWQIVWTVNLEDYEVTKTLKSLRWTITNANDQKGTATATFPALVR